MGMGWKQWTRERLSAASLQGYLQDQVVAHFPSASARAVALPNPTEGMHSYLLDEDVREVHDGTGWSTPEALGAKGYGLATAAFTTDGTGTEQRIIGPLNQAVRLRTGRQYRVTVRGRLSSSAAGAVSHLLVRAARGAGATVTNTSTCVASDRKVHSAATANGQQDANSSGTFTVAATDDYVLSPFLIVSTGTVTFLADTRGRMDLLVEDAGRAVASALTL